MDAPRPASRPARVVLPFAAVCATALAACSPPADPAPVGNDRSAVAGRAPPLFDGAWAATARLCDGGAWLFSAEDLVTAGEVSCRWTRLDRRVGGYDLEAACTAEGPPESYRLGLRFEPGDPNIMTVHGGPWASAQRLIRCGAPNAGEAARAEARAIDARVSRPGVRPRAFGSGLERYLVWREGGGPVRIVLPARTGATDMRGETVWWFRPGEAEPFLIRTPSAEFRFEDGRLVEWTERDGRAVRVSATEREVRAADLLDEARVLRRAAGG